MLLVQPLVTCHDTIRVERCLKDVGRYSESIGIDVHRQVGPY